ncbi:hypothetical protein BDZ45DRAFT_742440 [Acephala macrosclerotiorum]|nr:hypothetical protein BDZ45DRAFT_742440 [Acephala macrosclerotiorum]
MREIYTLSWSMIGFLGSEEDESWKAFQLLDILADSYGDPKKGMELRDRLLEKPDLFEHGSRIALNKFSTRPYRDRLWIIQELALGSGRTLMFCGDKSMDWERICHGFQVLHLYLWQAKDISISAERKTLNLTDTRTWINPGPLHHIWKDLWDLSRPENRKGLGLSRLLEISNFSKSMNPRDKVYGLLDLIPLEFANGIVPDYDIEAQEVYMCSAKAYIDAYQSLELLRDVNIWGKSGVPTRVPDWSWNGRLRNGRLRDSRPSRKYTELDMNPDTYVESPDRSASSQTEEAWYQADRNLPFTPVAHDGDYLICQGIIFDEVDSLGVQFWMGNASQKQSFNQKMQQARTKIEMKQRESYPSRFMQISPSSTKDSPAMEEIHYGSKFLKQMENLVASKQCFESVWEATRGVFLGTDPSWCFDC